MLNINGFEFFLISIAAILLLGPKQLAAAARKLGQYYSKLTRYADDFKSAVDSALEPVSEVKSELASNRRNFIDKLKPITDISPNPVITKLQTSNEVTVTPDDYLHPEYHRFETTAKPETNDFLGVNRDE